MLNDDLRKKIFGQLLGNLSIEEISELIYELDKDQYLHKPVDIETFVKDGYFLGNGIGENVYQYWIDKLKEIYPIPYVKPNREVIISGAISIGKTLIPLIGMLYEIYLLTTMKNPQRSFGIIDDTKINFVIFGDHYNIAFSYITDLISQSYYFSDKAVNNFKTDSILFTNNITLKNINKIEHAIGSATFGGFFDMYGHQYNKNIQQLERNYISILRRMQARFGNTSGILYLSGYPEGCPLFDLRSTALEGALVIKDVAIWDVKGISDNTSDKFVVCLGNKNVPPFIVNVNNTEAITGLPCIEVPVEYYDSFVSELRYSIRDLAGRKVEYREPTEKIVKVSCVSDLQNILSQLDSNTKIEIVGDEIIINKKDFPTIKIRNKF